MVDFVLVVVALECTLLSLVAYCSTFVGDSSDYLNLLILTSTAHVEHA